MSSILFKLICGYCVFISLFKFGLSGVTEKQLKNGAKLYRNNCQPKTKVTDELIDNMHIGKWDDDKTAKCYMNCVLTMMKLVDKAGNIAYELALAQMSKIPEARVAPTEKSIKNCKTVGADAADKCDASWQFAKCIYFDNTENYFLP